MLAQGNRHNMQKENRQCRRIKPILSELEHDIARSMSVVILQRLNPWRNAKTNALPLSNAMQSTGTYIPRYLVLLSIRRSLKPWAIRTKRMVLISWAHPSVGISRLQPSLQRHCDLLVHCGSCCKGCTGRQWQRLSNKSKPRFRS